LDDFIQRLHSSPTQIVIAATGGGVGAVAALAGVSGASRTLLGAAVPYSPPALERYLQERPEQACSAETAADLALVALARAREFEPDSIRDLLGFGITCSLTTDRERRGPNRCFVAVAGTGVSVHRELTLNKGARDRAGEEAVATALVLATLFDAAGIEHDLDLGLLGEEQVAESTPGARFWLYRLEDGRVDGVALNGAGEVVTDFDPDGLALLAGSYNPLHDGHSALMAASSSELNAPVMPEMSLQNVDKPPLSAGEILRRVSQFQPGDTVLITRAATFREKARSFPGATFVIGADTAVRLVDPKYYGDSNEGMQAALAEIKAAGCRFLVAGRVGDDGEFRALVDVDIPVEFTEMFADLPEARFRSDLSSSALRDARS